MLLNDVMLKGLNEVQTICQIAKKFLLKGGRFISDGSCRGIHSARMCTVSKSYNRHANNLGHMEIRHSPLYYELLIVSPIIMELL